ncbi:MAG TPA: hypothetical protein DCF33_15730 [Saprospirales bacterium]|nr:hypothetical protein [Saprospirales bacterium]
MFYQYHAPQFIGEGPFFALIFVGFLRYPKCIGGKGVISGKVAHCIGNGITAIGIFQGFTVPDTPGSAGIALLYRSIERRCFKFCFGIAISAGAPGIGKGGLFCGCRRAVGSVVGGNGVRDEFLGFSAQGIVSLMGNDLQEALFIK